MLYNVPTLYVVFQQSYQMVRNSLTSLTQITVDRDGPTNSG